MYQSSDAANLKPATAGSGAWRTKLPKRIMFQSESDNRQWMLKRGKKDMVYFDQKQVSIMEQYFKELDAQSTGFIGGR